MRFRTSRILSLFSDAAIVGAFMPSLRNGWSSLLLLFIPRTTSVIHNYAFRSAMWYSRLQLVFLVLPSSTSELVCFFREVRSHVREKYRVSGHGYERPRKSGDLYDSNFCTTGPYRASGGFIVKKQKCLQCRLPETWNPKFGFLRIITW